MKYLLMTLCAAALLGQFSACKKCYSCTTELPVTVNGVVVGTTPFTDDFCEKPLEANARVETLESEGYVCVEDD